ncbi:MAG: AAA family ATPase [Verrucomicrobiota bacterium]
MIELTLENYRAFGPKLPAHITIQRGVTALIGHNNAGKSLTLRFFFEMRPLFALLAEQERPPGDNEVFPLPTPQGVRDRNAIFHRSDQGPMRITLDYKHGPITILIDRGDFSLRILGAKEDNWRRILPIFHSFRHSLYFGAHRSMGRSSKALEQDSEPIEGFCQLWTKAIRDHPRQMEEARAEVYDAMRRLFSFSDFSAEVHEEGRVILKADQIETEIGEAGSGVSQAFLLMAQSAAFQPHYILIDEPECHLHPGCQIDFVTLMQGFAKYGLIAATHNLGLARAISEQVYQVQSVSAKGLCEIRPYQETNPRLSQSLGELDYAAQVESGCQKILLVEGPTEVKAIRQLLSKIKGGKGVIILPLGGSSMINGRRQEELAEISRICPNVYALIDSEKSSARAHLSDQHADFLNSCRETGIQAYALERRAFENYLTAQAVDRILGKKYRALKPFEDVNRSFPKWPKSENWRVVRAMKIDDFKGTDLYEFILKVIQDSCEVPQ